MSFFFKIWFTRFGLAWLLVCFMTSPTKNPNGLWSPFLILATTSGFDFKSWSMMVSNSEVSETWVRFLDFTILVGRSPESNMRSKTSLAILPEMVWSWMRVMSDEKWSGVRGVSAKVLPFESLPVSSERSHLTVAFGSLTLAFILSKKEERSWERARVLASCGCKPSLVNLAFLEAGSSGRDFLRSAIQAGLWVRGGRSGSGKYL